MLDKLSIRVELTGDVLSQFQQIKQTRNLELNTETIRYCITETYSQGHFTLENDLVDQIRQVLSSKYVKNKYFVYSMNDLIRNAVEDYIKKIYSERESIQSFAVRKELNPEETEIALAAIQVQHSSTIDMFTVEDILNHVNRKDKQNVTFILENFVERMILDKMNYETKTYYHARL